MSDTPFTKENIEELQRVCDSISGICKEHINGSLMMSQMMMLGRGIEKFIANPIVKQSGVLQLNLLDKLNQITSVSKSLTIPPNESIVGITKLDKE